MKKITILTTLLVFLAGAVYAAEIKLGYVDLNKALNESNEGKKAVKDLEDMVKEKRKVIAEKEKAIKAMDEEIAKQSSVLNPDAIKEKQEKRDQLMKEYQRMIKDSEDEVRKKQTDYKDSILKKIAQVVNDMGKEDGYTIIFERIESGILYMPEALDVTDKVIDKFNSSSKN